jgi:hypothetical protein
MLQPNIAPGSDGRCVLLQRGTVNGESAFDLWWPRIRAVSLFAAGLSGIVYETVWEHTDRPDLLILFGGMVGLEGVIRADAARRSRAS